MVPHTGGVLRRHLTRLRHLWLVVLAAMLGVFLLACIAVMLRSFTVFVG